MKKYIAIFALQIFFLAQFGKIINFCFCSLSVYEETKTFTCDCERQLFTAIKTDKTNRDQTSSTISSQLPAEELFHLSGFPSIHFNHTISFTEWPKTGSEDLYHAFEHTIFHPPLQLS